MTLNTLRPNAQEDIEIVSALSEEELDILENLEIVENLELLEDYEFYEELEILEENDPKKTSKIFRSFRKA